MKRVNIHLEDLHAVVAGVGDNHCNVAESYALRRRKVPVARALRAELEEEGAVGPEHLDAVVAGVGDGDQAQIIANCNALRRRKVPVARALRAEREGMGAIGVENLYSVVARVGDGNYAGV